MTISYTTPATLASRPSTANEETMIDLPLIQFKNPDAIPPTLPPAKPPTAKVSMAAFAQLLAGFDNDLLMDVEMLCELLHCHPSTVTRAVNRGELPRPAKIGSRNIWRAGDIRRHLISRAGDDTSQSTREAAIRAAHAPSRPERRY